MFKNFDMKKFILYVLGVAIAAFIIAGLIFVSTGGVKRVNSKVNKVTETKTVSMDNVNNISVDVSSLDIEVLPEERNDVKAELKGDITENLKNKYEFKADKNGNDINISYKDKNDFSFFSFNFGINNLKLYVYVPKDYNGNFNLHAASGNINIQDFKIKELEAKTSSGDIEIKGITSDNLKVRCTSGNISGENIETKDSNLSTSSGDIEIDKYKGNMVFDVISGSVSLKYEVVPEKISGKATSGDIKLKLPSDAEFYVDANVTSGDINCDFPVTMNSKGSLERTLKGTVISDKNKIEISTTSGNIDINK